jgi:hypothetical protein
MLLLPAPAARAQFPSDGLEMGAGYLPQIVSDGIGGALIAWLKPTGTDSLIFVKRVTSAGTVAPGWPAAGLAINTPATAPSLGNFVLTSDGTAGAIVAWSHQREGAADVLALRVTAGGQIASGWPAGGAVVCNGTSDLLTDLVPDSSGGAIAVWQDNRGLTIDLYAQRLTANGNVAPSWPANGVPLSLAAGSQLSGLGSADGHGGAFVAWEDYREDPAQRTAFADVYVQHILVNGQTANGWPADGAPACLADSAQLAPRVTIDGSGGAFVVWTDSRGSTTGQDAYEQHLGSGGGVFGTWPANGLALCGIVGPQYDVHVVSDGAGGSLTSWYDGESADPDSYAVYARRLTGSATRPPGWPPGCGVSACADVPEGVLADMISDGAGGALIAWRDNNLLTPYAQHVTSGGARDPRWPACGLPISSFTGFPHLAPDGASGLLAVWEAYGPDSTRIYVQHVTAAGQIAPPVAVGDLPQAGLRLGAPRPNPSRSGGRTELRLPEAAEVDAQVLDLAGRVVRVLAAHAPFPAGPSTLVWDGRDADGTLVPSGVYFLRASAGGARASVKIVCLR